MNCFSFAQHTTRSCCSSSVAPTNTPVQVRENAQQTTKRIARIVQEYIFSHPSCENNNGAKKQGQLNFFLLSLRSSVPIQFLVILGKLAIVMNTSWVLCTDSSAQRAYYYNVTTRQSSWGCPPEAAVEVTGPWIREIDQSGKVQLPRTKHC